MILNFLFIFITLLLLCLICIFSFSWIYHILKILKPEGKIFLEDVNDFLLPATVEFDKNKIAEIFSTESPNSQKRFTFDDEKNCSLFNMLYETETNVKNCCIGFGSCISHCPQEAIVLVKNKAVVLNSCIGCGQCISYCPNTLIKLIPRNQLKNKNNNYKKSFKFWKLCFTMINKNEEI